MANLYKKALDFKEQMFYNKHNLKGCENYE